MLKVNKYDVHKRIFAKLYNPVIPWWDWPDLMKFSSLFLIGCWFWQPWLLGLRFCSYGLMGWEHEEESFKNWVNIKWFDIFIWRVSLIAIYLLMIEDLVLHASLNNEYNHQHKATMEMTLHIYHILASAISFLSVIPNFTIL